MKGKARESSSGDELQFELKYCERCGGLWLRPVGGAQIYCMACAEAMGELPPVSHKAETARAPHGTGWDMDNGNVESYAEYDGLDLNAAGGVA